MIRNSQTMKRWMVLAPGPLLAISSPVFAADTPSTRLVACGSESCLLVTGRRSDSAAPVSINGHVVAARGTRHWRARVPVATVRAWSAPYARSVEVRVADTVHDARLPVGMLSPPRDLAMLEVRVK